MELLSTSLPTKTKDIIPYYNRLEEANLSCILSEGTVIDCNGVLRSPLCVAGEILRSIGFSTNDIKIGLITLLGLNSVHLGDPLAIEIIGEDGSYAPKLLKHCLDMTPESYVKQFKTMSLDDLYSAGSELKHKAIVTFDSKGLKQVSQSLNDLFSNGIIIEQARYKSKYGVGLQEVKIEGPIACVFLAKELKDSCLTVPSAIHLTLDSDQNSVDSELAFTLGQDVSEDSLRVDCARVRFIFERMNSQRVTIPYVDKIATILNGNIQNATGKAEMIKDLIANITRVNNPPTLSHNEIFARFFGMDKNAMAKWLEHKCRVSYQKLSELNGPGSVNNSEGLMSTKLDYYIFKVLMDGILTKWDEKLSPRRHKVFNAIKDLNLTAFKGESFTTERDSNNHILNALHCHGGERYWPNKMLIQNKIDSDGDETIPPSTLNMELNALIKDKCIESKKDTNTKRHIYAVATFDIDSIIALPGPSEILDPIYNGKRIEVVNPITGCVETI